MVIEHQQHAGESEHDKQVERDSAHAPGIAIAYRVAADLGWVQMKEDVRQHAQRTVAGRVIMLVAEDRSEDLGLGGVFQAFDLLFGFRRHVSLERLNVFFDTSFHALQQAHATPVLTVSILFRHWFLLSCFSKLQTRARRPRHTICYARKNAPSSLN